MVGGLEFGSESGRDRLGGGEGGGGRDEKLVEKLVR